MSAAAVVVVKKIDRNCDGDSKQLKNCNENSAVTTKTEETQTNVKNGYCAAPIKTASSFPNSSNFKSSVDSDVETQNASSDSDFIFRKNLTPDVTMLLQKMEAINKANEQDCKSVSGGTNSSRKSNDSSDSQNNNNNMTDSNAQSGQFHGQLSSDELDDLWATWGDLVKNWEIEVKKRPHYIKDLVRRGVPCHFRAIVWQLLCGCSGAVAPPMHEQYAEYMRGNSPHEKVIRRDVSRTYPEHEFFREANGRGQTSLFNVMKAYSLHDREVGYCQGSAFIAGLLLLQMPEEEAFYVLLKLMENYRLRELYKPAMTDLGLCMFQLECLVQETMPDLHMHFRNMGFDTSMYASSWFLTLFATQLPLELANRIMDVFMSEGMEMVFRIALAILQLCRYELLQLDMEGMLRCFQRDLTPKFEQDHDLLMSTAYNIKYNHKKLKKLEKDYLTKKIKEQEEAVELRRLRTENRLLRQRVEYLEQESSALADRLIDRQVFLAQEAENSVNIKHDMLTLREMNAEAHRRLEEAYETIRELTNKNREGFKDAEVQVDDKTMIEHIHTLQQDLIEVRSREADHENTIRDLKNRIHETESAYKRLKETPPDHCVAGLQEELIAVKMREAEANLSLKEMRQKISDLQSHWEKYIALTSNVSINSAPSSSKIDSETKHSSPTPPTGVAGQTPNPAFRDLQDQLMGVRLREAETAVELKEMRQRVMELETQNHVCTNQIRRQDDEYKKLQGELDVALGRERDVINQLNDIQHKLQDKESQLKEHLVMSKLKETELLTSIAELRNKIAECERKSCEKWTREELNKDDEDDFVRTPTSLTASYANIETSSVGSEADFAAYLAEMAVKIPPEAQSCFDKTLTSTDNDVNGRPLDGHCPTPDNNVNDPNNQCSSSGEESVSTLKNGTADDNFDYRRPKVLAAE